MTRSSVSPFLVALSWAAMQLVACGGDTVEPTGGSGGSAGEGGTGGTAGDSSSAGSSGANNAGAAGTSGTATVCSPGETKICGMGEVPDGVSAFKTCISFEGPQWTDCGEGAWSDCPSVNTPYPCTTADGDAGYLACHSAVTSTDASEARWGCYPSAGCKPGESYDCGVMGVTNTCFFNGTNWAYDPSGCNTPLVLSFDGSAVAFTNPQGHFDLNGRASVRTDWVSSQTPWLALDVNGNGRIDDGSELFGSMTTVGATRAHHGFEALSALDSDGDGWITSSDAAFDKLVLWSDLDQDRASSPAELTKLSELGVQAIQLSYTLTPRCDAHACERERAAFYYTDATGQSRRGAVIDVYFSAY